MADEVVEEPVPTELPLIEAKLAQPRIRAGVIARARLVIALDRLEKVELTMISGPVGSGKTVLVSSWLVARRRTRPRCGRAPACCSPTRSSPLRSRAVSSRTR
jgi:hypothetical protein